MRYGPFLIAGAAAGTVVSLPAQSAELAVKLELPEIASGTYMNPYVALFLEKDDDTFVRSLSLWHKTTSRRGGQAGDRYLNSLRDWWRSSGTTSQLPIDGVSSATRGVGAHEVAFTPGRAPLGELPPGKYQLVVEVAREIKGPRPQGFGPGEGRPPRGERGPSAEGGQRGPSKDALEELRIPFEWPVRKDTTLTAKGKAELGAVSLTLKP